MLLVPIIAGKRSLPSEAQDLYGRARAHDFPLFLQAGSSEAQLGALRHVWLGDLGFVEQLDGLDDDRKLM